MAASYNKGTSSKMKILLASLTIISIALVSIPIDLHFVWGNDFSKLFQGPAAINASLTNQIDQLQLSLNEMTGKYDTSQVTINNLENQIEELTQIINVTQPQAHRYVEIDIRFASLKGKVPKSITVNSLANTPTYNVGYAEGIYSCQLVLANYQQYNVTVRYDTPVTVLWWTLWYQPDSPRIYYLNINTNNLSMIQMITP